jgi:Holliday junction resolvasome RuvABC ATP-dependent DNA helicase subunit
VSSVPFYRDFVAIAASAYRPRREPRLAQRGLVRRVLDAIALSHQRAVERDIARVLGLGNPGGPLTDEIERRLFEHLTRDRGFRP